MIWCGTVVAVDGAHINYLQYASCSFVAAEVIRRKVRAAKAAMKLRTSAYTL